MCVNNLPRVALDNGGVRIQTSPVPANISSDASCNVGCAEGHLACENLPMAMFSRQNFVEPAGLREKTPEHGCRQPELSRKALRGTQERRGPTGRERGLGSWERASSPLPTS